MFPARESPAPPSASPPASRIAATAPLVRTFGRRSGSFPEGRPAVGSAAIGTSDREKRRRLRNAANRRATEEAARPDRLSPCNHRSMPSRVTRSTPALSAVGRAATTDQASRR